MQEQLQHVQAAILGVHTNYLLVGVIGLAILYWLNSTFRHRAQLKSHNETAELIAGFYDAVSEKIEQSRQDVNATIDNKAQFLRSAIAHKPIEELEQITQLLRGAPRGLDESAVHFTNALPQLRTLMGELKGYSFGEYDEKSMPSQEFLHSVERAGNYADDIKSAAKALAKLREVADIVDEIDWEKMGVVDVQRLREIGEVRPHAEQAVSTMKALSQISTSEKVDFDEIPDELDMDKLVLLAGYLESVGPAIRVLMSLEKANAFELPNFNKLPNVEQMDSFKQIVEMRSYVSEISALHAALEELGNLDHLLIKLNKIASIDMEAVQKVTEFGTSRRR